MLCNLSNSEIFNNLEWPLTHIFRARHYSRMNISETAQNGDILLLRAFSGFGAISRLPMGIFRILGNLEIAVLVRPLVLSIRLSHTTTNDRRPRLRRCCTARLERSACQHRFCTVTGHFQAALEDSSVWTIIRLTTDLVTCPWSFAYGRLK